MTVDKKYTIKKITDIFKIPNESFDDFLIDFREFYKVGNSMTALIDGVSDVLGVKAKYIPQKMVWTDDKKHNVHIKIGVKQ